MDLIYRYDPHQPIAHENYADAEGAQRALFEGNRRFADIVDQMQKATLGESVQSQVIIPVSPLSLGLPLWPGGCPTRRPSHWCWAVPTLEFLSSRFSIWRSTTCL